MSIKQVDTYWIGDSIAFMRHMERTFDTDTVNDECRRESYRIARRHAQFCACAALDVNYRPHVEQMRKGH